MTNSTAANEVSRREFIKAGATAGGVAVAGLGGFALGYGKALGSPVRIGVIGTGDEGSVLMGALNPQFLQVRSICDIRPYNRYRAFHGEMGVPTRPGLLSVYGWKSEAEARKHVKVYEGSYEDLIRNAKRDGVEAVVIALPLHLHAPAAMAAMDAGLHVITEKLMAHTVGQCKEMARKARETRLCLAVGHQRHYNILYAQAMDHIRRGLLGDVHYIRAQWHRSNLPEHDSWQQPLPPGVKPEKASEALAKKLKDAERQVAAASGAELLEGMRRVAQLKAQVADIGLHTECDENGKPLAEVFGYEQRQWPVVGPNGKPAVYDRPAIEELIRWRLFDRTGAGLMAELGSHQLDAASLFLAAMLPEEHGEPQHLRPLSVIASATRPLFPRDRDVEDHVFCVIEFPAPGYDAQDPVAGRKKIAVQYASINGNGFGGYGEIVYGTKGTLILKTENELTLLRGPAAPSSLRVTAAAGGPTLDTQSSGPAPQAAAATGGKEAVSRGYAEELEHWAWCIRHRSPENRPRCHPEVAMGDAIIALTTNLAARHGQRIEFKPEWFDMDQDETPEDLFRA
jgi:predicted dehydrogenase